MSSTATTPAIAAPQAGVWAMALDLLFSPVEGARQLAQRRGTLLLSLLGYLLVFTALWLAYYRAIDFPWLKDFLADLAVRMHPGISAAQVRQGMSHMPLSAMVASTLVAGLATMLLEVLARAVYHHLIAHVISEREVHFGSWFALVCWSILPSTLMLLLALVNVCMSDSAHMAPSQVGLSSLNAALLHLPVGHPWSMWAGALDLRLIWTIAMTAGGLTAWLGLPRSKAWFWAALPYLVFFGIWALVRL